MYSIYDYAYNGLLYLNNVMRLRNKRLSQLMIYSTTLCQSKCKHCNIWQKRPVEHLFCLSPWNTFDDMAYVIDVARRYGIDIRIGIYGTMAFFDTTSELLTASDFVKQIPQSILLFTENGYPYIRSQNLHHSRHPHRKTAYEE